MLIWSRVELSVTTIRELWIMVVVAPFSLRFCQPAFHEVSSFEFDRAIVRRPYKMVRKLLARKVGIGVLEIDDDELFVFICGQKKGGLS